MTDRWLADVALYGTAADIRAGVEVWQSADITTPILMPVSPTGDPAAAYEALFRAFG